MAAAVISPAVRRHRLSTPAASGVCVRVCVRVCVCACVCACVISMYRHQNVYLYIQLIRLWL